MARRFVRKALSVFLVSCVLILTVFPLTVQANTPTSFFVVGYVTGYSISDGRLPDMEISHLSHIIWQGVAPTSGSDPTLISVTGDPINQLTTVTTAAHAVGVKSLVSLCGPWGDTALTTIVGNAGLRSQLVTNLVNLVATYSLDGVDIDWEQYPGITKYDSLINDLYAQLNPLGKIISVVGNWDAFDFSVSAVDNKVAFVNIMAYDMYRPNPYPYHSLYADAIAVMQNWVAHGYAKNKLVMGIPDYGRDDALGLSPMWVTYGGIVDTLHPTDAQNYATIATYQGVTVSGGVLWWGGPALARQKTQWVKDNLYGGVFIYELGTDKFHSNMSIFRNIYQTLEAGAAVTLSSIAVTPSSLTNLAVGATYQYTAMGTNSDNSQTNLTLTATWVSSNTTVATISASGIVTGQVAGSSNITAASGIVTSGVATLTVVVPPVTLSAISVTPSSPANLTVGYTQQFTAIGTYSDGSNINLTSSVNWTSSASSKATISVSGLATGVSAGSTNIRASLSGVNSSLIPLTVVAPVLPLTSIVVSPSSANLTNGATRQFTATGTYADNSTANISSNVTWATSNITVATVSITGLVTGLTPGTTNITASASGGINSIPRTVTVLAVTLSSISVTPSSPNHLAVGSAQQFTATGTYSDSSNTDITANVTWASSVLGVATISSGLATAVSAGSTNITATSGNITSPIVSLIVVNPPAALLSSISVTPATLADRNVGETQQFIAVGFYSDSSNATITSQVTWVSSNYGVATIAANGLATSIGIGTTNVTASLSGAVSNTVVMRIVDPVAPPPTPPTLSPVVLPITTGSQFAKDFFPLLVMLAPVLLGLKMVHDGTNQVAALFIVMVLMIVAVAFMPAIEAILSSL